MGLDGVFFSAIRLASFAFSAAFCACAPSTAKRSQRTSSDSERALAPQSRNILVSLWSRRDSRDSSRAVSLMLSDLSFSWSRRLFSPRICLPRWITSLLSRVISLRCVLIVSFWCRTPSGVTRTRCSCPNARPTASFRAFDAATVSRGDPIMRSLPGSRPASKRSCCRRANSARREGTSFAARRASFASSVAAFSLLRLRSSCHFSEPARARESTSAQRSSSARASAASARARSCANRDRQSRDGCVATTSGGDQSPSSPTTRFRSVPKSSSRIAMRSTIAHRKSRYQPC